MSEKIRTVSTDRAPAAIGPYSQAVVAGGLVITSGQIALDPASGEIVPGGIEEQTRAVLAHLSSVLEAAGTSLQDVLRCTVYLKDMNHFATVNGIYAEAFSGHAPARAAVEVSRLPKDVLVEIDAIALAP